MSIEAPPAPAAAAKWLLRGVGASISSRGRGGAALSGTADAAASDGLPPRTVEYTTGAALALSALAGWRSEESVELNAASVATDLRLPEVVNAGPDRPGPPRRAPGGGWVQADLGRPGDAEDFATVLSVAGPGADAYTVATTAQQWRLPVCDYRRRPPAPRATPPLTMWLVDKVLPGRRTGRLFEGIRICELTSMWAGPLASALLARLGAEVIRIEPDSRPDGFRAAPAMWDALNAGKIVEPLDLRDGAHRSLFVELAGSCDVVFDTFSPRVMPNFGLDEAVMAGPRQPTRVSMPAFAPGPEHDWVAFGSGVHAVLGLGDLGERFAAPAVSYPDPVGGYVAGFAMAVSVVARDLGIRVGRLRTSLAEASAPLLAHGTVF